jgi:hypothetical protein
LFGCSGLRFLVVHNFRFLISGSVFNFDDERSTLFRTNGFTGGTLLPQSHRTICGVCSSALAK